MNGTWLTAFAVATFIAAAATPLLRRVAVKTGFVDVPAPTKSHARPVPYLGGVAIAGATLAGWLLESELSSRVGVVAIAAVAVGLTGLLDDHRKLEPWVRLIVESAAAAAVVGAGVRAEVTSIVVVDIAITMIWIIGVTNALNLLDNMDGLSAGTAAVAAAGAFALAAIEGQGVLATVAIALCGACLGFLAHNWRRASIFMGDAGALFIGFVLAVAVLELVPAVPSPESLAVPALLLGLPVLDTSLVSIARVRRGGSVFSGGKDHLSHRLVMLGLAPGFAVSVLVGTEGIFATLAVLSGSGAVPVWAAAVMALTVAAALATVATRADVYGDAPVVVHTDPRSQILSTLRRRDRELVSVGHELHGGPES